jgi:hypothetical protein
MSELSSPPITLAVLVYVHVSDVLLRVVISGSSLTYLVKENLKKGGWTTE